MSWVWSMLVSITNWKKRKQLGFEFFRVSDYILRPKMPHWSKVMFCFCCVFFFLSQKNFFTDRSFYTKCACRNITGSLPVPFCMILYTKNRTRWTCAKLAFIKKQWRFNTSHFCTIARCSAFKYHLSFSQDDNCRNCLEVLKWLGKLVLTKLSLKFTSIALIFIRYIMCLLSVLKVNIA